MENQIVLVTGCGGGIGAACARLLLEDGSRVTAIDVKPIHESVVAAGSDDTLIPLNVDVTSLDACRDAVRQTVSDDQVRQIVLSREAQVRSSGMSGVPGFLLNRRLLVVGHGSDNLLDDKISGISRIAAGSNRMRDGNLLCTFGFPVALRHARVRPWKLPSVTTTSGISMPRA